MSANGLQAGRSALSAATSAVGRVVFSVGTVTADSGAWRAYESATREALSQFWAMKAADWTQSTPNEQIQWTILDAEAHKIWARLESQLKWTDERANIDAHGRTEAEALQKAETLYLSAGRMTEAARTSRAASSGAMDTAAARRSAVDASYSTAFWDQAGNVLGGDILGVPTWAWIAGGGLLVVLLVAGRR